MQSLSHAIDYVRNAKTSLKHSKFVDREFCAFKYYYEAIEQDLKDVGNDLIREINTKKRRVISVN